MVRSGLINLLDVPRKLVRWLRPVVVLHRDNKTFFISWALALK
jgi:hypothetical protein